jgi:2'-hydroxyisoflavone reductase
MSNILIIGGTVFLGRACTQSALSNGDTITLFNRGKSAADIPEGVKVIHGDRNEDFSALDDYTFDTVIDTCCYFPRQARKAAQYFKNKASHYIFISSVSVYADLSSPTNEESPLAQTSEPEATQITGQNYGALKALCEQEILQVFGKDHCTIIRPGLITGPFDPTDRFTFWPLRCGMENRNQGMMMAPGAPDSTAWEWIDVRDLANWIIHCSAHRISGIYNATGPRIPAVQIFESAFRYFGKELNLVWKSDTDLLKKNAGPWSEVPLWIPTTEPAMAGFYQTDCSAARSNGLQFRDIDSMVHDTLRWALSRPAEYTLRAGYSEQREAEFLE